MLFKKPYGENIDKGPNGSSLTSNSQLILESIFSNFNEIEIHLGNLESDPLDNISSFYFMFA